MAMVSPRHVPSRQQFSLAQPNIEPTLANRHSVAANRSARSVSLSAAGMSRSMVLVDGTGSDSELPTAMTTPNNTPNNGRRLDHRSSPTVNGKMATKRIPLTVAAEFSTNDTPATDVCDKRRAGAAHMDYQ
ncbi:unnamed protein product [Gongylonema pulchrum]|uniref:Uncharacterized protein n=1 Tax=Gongylonema pulchrum TaxID=637853 RepID=A0A3P7LQ30_9BILA|nr:unnamed protein product [Gongylonema pulchrum]